MAYNNNSYSDYRSNQGGGGYSNTGYGAQGGNDSGGFMQGSQGASQGPKNYGTDSIRPVTVMQILEYATPIETNNNNEIMLDGSEAKRVTIVGQVRNVSEQTTNVTYKLDDGTGTIEVKVWNQEGKDEFSESKSSKQKLEAGMWARATGEVKTMGRKHLLGHNIKRVTDMNEISYHLLDATYVHLYFTKGPIDAKAKTEDGDQMDYAQQNGGGNNLVGVGPLAKKVFQCLQQTEFGQEGLHMQHIASLTNMSMADVGKAGDELIQRSLIYTTIDDQTWAILES